MIKHVVAVALFLGFGVGGALAGPADDAIKARQNCMKNGNGAMVGALLPIAKGEKAFDAAAVAAATALESAACADWDKWWSADTQKGESVETWAKPEVWTDAKGFEAAGGAWYQGYEAMKAAKDDAAFKAGFKQMTDGCQGCHEKFRRPKS